MEVKIFPLCVWLEKRKGTIAKSAPLISCNGSFHRLHDMVSTKSKELIQGTYMYMYANVLACADTYILRTYLCSWISKNEFNTQNIIENTS